MLHIKVLAYEPCRDINDESTPELTSQAGIYGSDKITRGDASM